MSDAEYGDPISRIIFTAQHLQSFAQMVQAHDTFVAGEIERGTDPIILIAQRNANFSMVEDLHKQLGELIAVARKDFYK